MDDLRIHPRGAKEVLAAPVVELGREVIALLCGELPEAPKGEAWFFGTPTGRHHTNGYFVGRAMGVTFLDGAVRLRINRLSNRNGS